MIETSRAPLTKYGLSVIQQVLPNEDGQMIMHTILCHESGQWIIVFPESEKSGRKTVKITFPDKRKKSSKITITQGKSATMERIFSDP